MENDSTHPISRSSITPKVPSLGFGKAEVEEAFDKVAQGNEISASKLYFVYSEEFNQVLHDPMTGKPVHSRNRNVLREAAKEFKGKIVDGKTAIRLILKHGPKQIPPSTPV